MKLKLLFCLFTVLLVSGCEVIQPSRTPFHRNIFQGPSPIHRTALAENTNRTFWVGVVKTSGGMPFISDNFDKKAEALKRIPIESICSILATNFGITIQPYINRTIEMVKEEVKQYHEPGTSTIRMTIRNAYYGNQSYCRSGLRNGPPTGADEEKIKEGIDSLIYLDYKMRTGGNPFCIQDIFTYNLYVMAEDKILLHFKGEVAHKKSPKKGLFHDIERTWDNFIECADDIPKALIRDIRRAKIRR